MGHWPPGKGPSCSPCASQGPPSPRRTVQHRLCWSIQGWCGTQGSALPGPGFPGRAWSCLRTPGAAMFAAVGRKAAREKGAARRGEERISFLVPEVQTPSLSWGWSHPTYRQSPFDLVSRNLLIRVSKSVIQVVLPDPLIKTLHIATC